MGISIDGSFTATPEEILKRKLEQAKAYLGNKLVTAKGSTFKYVRGPSILGQYKETNNECSY